VISGCLRAVVLIEAPSKEARPAVHDNDLYPGLTTARDTSFDCLPIENRGFDAKF
jgi:hypothetical protein